MSDRRPRLRIGLVVRLAGSALVLAAIFSVLPLGDVLAAIRSIQARDWLSTLVIFLIGHVVAAAKWQQLADSGAGFPAVLRAHFAGLIANVSLPGIAGGDVVRAALLYRQVPDTTRLALGSVADRLLDTIGLLLLAAGGLIFALPYFASGADLLIWIGVTLAVFAIAVAIAIRFHPLLLRRLPPGGGLRRVGELIADGSAALLRRPFRLVVCLVLSIAVQTAFVVANIQLATAAGVHAPLAAWFFAWPLSKLIATLPISVGGIGVREASLAGFLAPFGASPAAVVATGLLWQSILLAGALLGGVVLFLSTRALARVRTGAPEGGDSRPSP